MLLTVIQMGGKGLHETDSWFHILKNQKKTNVIP